MNSAKEVTEDKRVFPDQLIYCNQHLAVHIPGWCTVPVRNKIGLGIAIPVGSEHDKVMQQAAQKCRDFGLKLYADAK